MSRLMINRRKGKRNLELFKRPTLCPPSPNDSPSPSSAKSTTEEEDESSSSSIDEKSMTEHYNEILAELEACQSARKGTPGTLYDPIVAPDNYTPENFLSNLRRNPYPHEMEIHNIVLKSGRFVIQLCGCIIFHILYYHLVNGTLEPGGVMIGCFLTCSIGYFYSQILPAIRASPPESRSLSNIGQYFPKEHMKLISVYLLFSYQLAPVLRTLTSAVSTNTIHYISGITLFLHLLTTNYGMESFVTSRTLSVNAAVVGSICLTSRLASNYHSLALLSLAVEIFVLFPMFSNCVWDSLVILILTILVTGVALLTVSAGIFLLYGFVVFLVLGLIPMFLIYGLQFKNNIYGPWDEAVIEPYVSPNPTPKTRSRVQTSPSPNQ